MPILLFLVSWFWTLPANPRADQFCFSWYKSLTCTHCFRVSDTRAKRKFGINTRQRRADNGIKSGDLIQRQRLILELIDPAANPDIPPGIQRLQKAYPDFIAKADANSITLKDGSVFTYDDGKKNKSFQELLDQPDLEDQFRYAYPQKFPVKDGIPVNQDPGRIRFMPFYMKMYGSTQEEVRANLREIIWLPKTIGAKILVTKVNGVDKKLEAISQELDKLPALKQYLENPGGTFLWRVIKGTNRLSMHSFGMTIDINVKYSHYWQWDCKCTNEDANLGYKNSIPKQVVEIFEKHGFIWGGKWYHYDSMHFEYRPEFL